MLAESVEVGEEVSVRNGSEEVSVGEVRNGSEEVSVGEVPDSVLIGSVAESVGVESSEEVSVTDGSSVSVADGSSVSVGDGSSVSVGDGSSVHVGLSVGALSVASGSGMDVVAASVPVGSGADSVSVSVGADSVSVSVGVGLNVIVVNSPERVGLGSMMTVIVSYSVDEGSGTSVSVHVALGSTDSVGAGSEESVGVGSEESVEVGSESVDVGSSVGAESESVEVSVGSVSVSVGVESPEVSVGVGSDSESVGVDSLALGVSLGTSAGAVAVFAGGLPIPKSTLTVSLPMSVCASENRMQETKIPVVSEAGTARQVVFDVQGVISQLPSPEHLASWEVMQAIWPGVHSASRCNESKKKLEPCAISAGVVGSARTARAEVRRDQMGIALTVQVVSKSAAVMVDVENMLTGLGKGECKKVKRCNVLATELKSD